MTASAVFTLVSPVNIILFMAVDALSTYFVVVHVTLVALVTARFPVFAEQWEISFFAVIKCLLLPVRRCMAVLAFFTVPAFVAVIILMAVVALFWQFFVHVSRDMTAVTARFFMFS